MDVNQIVIIRLRLFASYRGAKVAIAAVTLFHCALASPLMMTDNSVEYTEVAVKLPDLEETQIIDEENDQVRAGTQLRIT